MGRVIENAASWLWWTWWSLTHPLPTRQQIHTALELRLREKERHGQLR